ncbi:hypothetical protein GOP47_0002630 [Adiantum capillus-veneris]|uniref:Uncharacterized protein n=1 Tax=Adiantum capillus-veneris TaxID=13818 RepID=A0A9D4VCF8_ADICA|nr:hypothetical protein GOP47_0002630 [Adiantum capillus-veneris]
MSKAHNLWNASCSSLLLFKERSPCELQLPWPSSLCYRKQPLFRVRGLSQESSFQITPSDGPASSFSLLTEVASEPSLTSPPDPSLANKDLLPTSLSERTFSAWDIVSLWVGLVVGVPSYYLAGSLVELGMSWWQGIFTVMAGNFLLFFPLIWTGHAGIKYGIPFPVMARASFGIHGAHIATILRALVACGWFGIETWIGGQGIYVLLNALLEGKLAGSSIMFMGSALSEWVCFFSFWLLQVAILWNGVDSIRQLEKYCAPVLIIMSIALLMWAYLKAGGFGAMLAAPSQFVVGGARQGQFWQVFFPALTANIGFWATISLNMPGHCHPVQPVANPSHRLLLQASSPSLSFVILVSPVDACGRSSTPSGLVASKDATSLLAFVMPHFCLELPLLPL